MNLQIGVLTIGSLYWDKKRHREKWRRNRLQIKNEAAVTVPIRYGRKSNTRGDTYTMVFSPGCVKGQAKAVPCVRSISSVEGLIGEAEALWRAECKEGAKLISKQKTSASWGCVALIAHPKFERNGEGIRLGTLFDGWKAHVSHEQNYSELSDYGAFDGSSVNSDGILQIDWPELADGSGPLALDLLLATVTKPEVDANSREYPSVAMVAEAWKRGDEKYVRYFWCNRSHGIHTFQDDDIVTFLNTCS